MRRIAAGNRIAAVTRAGVPGVAIPTAPDSATAPEPDGVGVGPVRAATRRRGPAVADGPAAGTAGLAAGEPPGNTVDLAAAGGEAPAGPAAAVIAGPAAGGGIAAVRVPGAVCGAGRRPGAAAGRPIPAPPDGSVGPTVDDGPGGVARDTAGRASDRITTGPRVVPFRRGPG